MATIERGCGYRTKGSCYVECRTGPDGFPVEHFLVDPPKPVDTAALGLTPRGVRLIERDGVWHVFDWVGEQFYKNVADFVEEVRRFGLSRKLNPKMDFSKLGPMSRIVLLHARAVIKNHKQYKSGGICPKGHQTHHENKEMCVKLYWEDIRGGEPDPNLFDQDPRLVRRKMPSFSYAGKSTPEGVEPEYQVGIFASFPIHALVVVNDPEQKSHKPVFERATEANVRVELVED